jgi:soluble lytic murein transglycosylase-like protein
MSCKQNLISLIADEAAQQGVPVSIALSVARRESGACHWDARGSVIRGAAGEIGVMQLMPATAASLGVDPWEASDNIRGGMRYLANMYRKFGSWPLAVAAYNCGDGCVRQMLAGRRNLPASTVSYVAAVTGTNLGYGSPYTNAAQSRAVQLVGTADNSNSSKGLLVIGGAALLSYLLLS